MTGSNHRAMFWLMSAAAALVVTACGGNDQPANTTTSPTAQPPGTSSVSASATGTATSAPSSTSTPALLDQASYYAENCAVCHGNNRDGVGRAPALTPDALTDSIEDYLDETDNRTHRAIWSQTTLSEEDRRTLLEYLANTSP